MSKDKTANYRRMLNEVKQIRDNATEYAKMFKLTMVNDDMYHWDAIIYGPEDSLYEGYHFKLDIKLPDNYPFAPLTVKFITPIQHVNINSEGNVCLDILKNNWAPSQNIQSVMLSLQVLLSSPNTDDPLNSDLAEMYRNDQKGYTKKIKEYCKKHAIKNST